MRRLAVPLLLALALGVGACGKKGEPLTPSESARQQAEQEKQQQRKNAE